MKLYTYWRSTTSYRVRIALHLKGLTFEAHSVDLVAGAQRDDAYLKLNPIGGVPTLMLEDGTALAQSMAILEYLDAAYPEPALLSSDPKAAGQERAAAMIIASDIHPINNLKVLKKLKRLGQSQEDIVAWINDWMTSGFHAFQSAIKPDTPFCFGDTPGLADLCLVPQLYNAHRWGCDLAPFGRLSEIEARCLDLPAFDAARPEMQPDADG